MARPKPARRLPRPKRRNIIHPDGLSKQLLEHRTRKQRPQGAVTAGELQQDVLTFIATQYAGRHLDIEVAQLGLSNAAHQLIVAHLRAVAAAD